MSPGNFGKIERGEVALSIDNLEKIAIYLEMPLSQLLSENQAHENAPDYPHLSKSDLARMSQQNIHLQHEMDQMKAQLKQLQDELKKLRNSLR